MFGWSRLPTIAPFRLHFISVLCTLAVHPALVSAQTTTVSGAVEDQAGGRLPGVSIELTAAKRAFTIKSRT